ncbi:hypothetical protein [Streptomyces sp. NBRC 110465]|uniref:hypothetical protein n=1 Tax=Streptomyces sp. NBRC 110465 TaxID=1897621 RepID=UPI0009339DE9|nr:hypothetical protein [Streptomyces sp. NBRC 110465]
MTLYRRTLSALAVVAAAGGSLATAAPASAGGVGDFLSPAFGTDCANHRVGTQAAGATTAGTGAANANVLGLPLGSALNQCGGADLPVNCDFADSAASSASSLTGVGQIRQLGHTLDCNSIANNLQAADIL